MTRNAVMLRGRKVVLISGAAVELWVEAGADEVLVLVMDGQHLVGRAAASRSRHHGAATLTAWTESPWRRRGVGRAAVAAVVEWAQEQRIRYLVGAANANDEVARRFLGGVGLVLATRTDEDVRRFALLVPSASPSVTQPSVVQAAA